MRHLAFASFFVALAACSTSSGTSPNDGGAAAGDGGVEDAAPVDAAVRDASADAPSGACASAFGDQLTAGFGRIDGVVYAVQKPSDTQCAMPNATHVVVQVLMEGAVYRMVVNVQSDRDASDLRVSYAEEPHPLPAPAFAEGWHTDAPLDYVTTLGAHADAFQPMESSDLVAKLAGEIHPGDPISVYATVGAGRPDSAHLVHRNATNQDGAIVLAPTGASPTFLLFHFVEQTF